MKGALLSTLHYSLLQINVLKSTIHATFVAKERSTILFYINEDSYEK